MLCVSLKQELLRISSKNSIHETGSQLKIRQLQGLADVVKVDEVYFHA